MEEGVGLEVYFLSPEDHFQRGVILHFLCAMNTSTQETSLCYECDPLHYLRAYLAVGNGVERLVNKHIKGWPHKLLLLSFADNQLLVNSSG